MWSFTHKELICISFILIAFIVVYVTFIFYIIEKSIYKSENRIKMIIANSDQCLTDKMKSIDLTINDFEINTRKNIDKRFGNMEKTLEGYLNLITGLTNQCREHTDELCKVREKFKLTIGKNKLIEEKIDSIIDISNNESINNIIRTIEITNVKMDGLEAIVNKLTEYIDDIKNIKKNFESDGQTNNSKYDKVIEQITLLNNSNKSFKDKINNLEKKYKLTEGYVKNNDFDRVIEEIDLLKLNFQKINDEMTIMEKMSEITSDSISIDTKNLDENIKNVDNNDLNLSEQNIYKLYNLSQKDYYIKIIKKLIQKDTSLVELHKDIETKFKEKYPGKEINCPDGFSQFILSSDGEKISNPDSLHLLSTNYKNSRKFIEIIFCKHFIDLIDIKKNYPYYVSGGQDDTLFINRFNVNIDMIALEDEEPVNEYETYCLKGIYYVLNKRIKTLERFNNSYKIFI